MLFSEQFYELNERLGITKSLNEGPSEAAAKWAAIKAKGLAVKAAKFKKLADREKAFGKAAAAVQRERNKPINRIKGAIRKAKATVTPSAKQKEQGYLNAASKMLK